MGRLYTPNFLYQDAATMMPVLSRAARVVVSSSARRPSFIRKMSADTFHTYRDLPIYDPARKMGVGPAVLGCATFFGLGMAINPYITCQKDYTDKTVV